MSYPVFLALLANYPGLSTSARALAGSCTTQRRRILSGLGLSQPADYSFLLCFWGNKEGGRGTIFLKSTEYTEPDLSVESVQVDIP